MSRFLAAVAGALGHVLGLARPLAVPRPEAPLVSLVAMASPWYPSASLGLPGDWTPQTGGMP